MPDVFTKQKRSEVMSRIRSRGNKRTELAAVDFFRRNGIKGWRRHALLKFKGASARAISRPAPNIGSRRRLAVRGDARPTRLAKPPQTSLTSRSSREQAGPAPNAARGRRGLHSMRRALPIPHSALRVPHLFRVRPDFVFQKTKVAVFIDGCFWHGCPQHGTQPSGNRLFWQQKLARNRERDRLVSRTLRKAGWRVVRVWEHELRDHAKMLRRLHEFKV